MTHGTSIAAVTMVTQSFNNADYYTGPSLIPRLSVGVEKERAWYPLFLHDIISQKSWEIGNYYTCTYPILSSAYLLTNNEVLSIVCSTSPSSNLQYS